jgi:spore coat polysaccharide biosynthesis protein SpsF (cytidylyltransferase family)
MRIGGIIQARMKSDRLPGKVLHQVHGKPMLEYLLERLEQCTSLDSVVVATSTDQSDDPVERFCRKRGRDCYRGSLSNVANRFRDVLDVYRFDAFVRVSGDSPLLDPKLVDLGVEHFGRGQFDLVTNVFPRSYPRGQSVEVIRADTFRWAADATKTDDEKEHVTLFFYRNPDKFRIFNFTADADYTGLQLAVDSIGDMERFEAIVNAMEGPHWQYGLEQIREIYRHVSSGQGLRT